ncbi:unnamed protein product [Blepharisma stoltei]|uniref:Uncharacterized protein n=1 Tax=Blepharisma stoltei TaxID=1481888 RepID=A0AAU9ISP0_9CILI|nr:unnamed protein product [Blepharisma stoltei]
MDLNIGVSKSSKSDSLSRYYTTIEGVMIEYIKTHSQVKLSDLLEFMDLRKKGLRNVYSRKYKVKCIGELAIAKLTSNRKIFKESTSGVWTIDSNASLEYEQQKIKEIEEIRKRSNKARAEWKKISEIRMKEEEKFDIFGNFVSDEIYNKLEQLDEIMSSSNQNIQKNILALYED